MIKPSAGDITRQLAELREGDNEAFDRLFGFVYERLTRMVAGQLRQERPDHTLDATALVHEAYLKLVDQRRVDWQDRAHFFAVAGRAMRQVLVDHARRRDAAKRGGRWERTTLGNLGLPGERSPEELLALDEALVRLDRLNPRLRQVVEYRFFGGLNEQEIAEVLVVTQRTVQRDWVKARAWLYKELYPDAE